jgi:glycosyltransferase involved in cell wall biosynthesis
MGRHRREFAAAPQAVVGVVPSGAMSADPIDLAVAMTAHNSMRTIERALRSVAGLAAGVVVIDSGSDDGTVEACRAMGAEVVHRAWGGHVAQKQFAIDRCSDHRWTLLLDSDESLESPLQQSMRAALVADDPAMDGWMVNRKVHFLGEWLHHAFQPEWRLRLFRSGRGRVAGRDPHDQIVVNGRVGRLTGDVRHDSWSDLDDMLHRYVGYARRTAEAGGRGGTLGHVLLSPAAAFLKQAVVKRGILDGWRGLIAAGGSAAGTLMKHLYLAEQRHRERGG